jgi:polyhydroxyalkanoate synthesis repressor PhaR
MDDETRPPKQRILLRKYRNRRYYDSTRSLHVTLEDIYELVRAGHDIQVTDSQTGEDITPRVLAQIILEQDPLKLDVFPVEFLHRVIRANEPLIREFMDRYFSQFLEAYLDSQRQLSEYVRQTMGLGLTPAAGSDWFRMMMRPFGQAASSDASGVNPSPRPADAAEPDVAQLRKVVEELRQQIDTLGERKPRGAS